MVVQGLFKAIIISINLTKLEFNFCNHFQSILFFLLCAQTITTLFLFFSLFLFLKFLGLIILINDELIKGRLFLLFHSTIIKAFNITISLSLIPLFNYLSCSIRKPTICIYENKGADQLHGDREADQCLYFRYMDSTISLLLKSKISSF